MLRTFFSKYADEASALLALLLEASGGYVLWLLHPTMSDVTQILERVERGDGKAAEELLPLVYEELRKLAALKWPGNRRATRCRGQRWCTKHG